MGKRVLPLKRALWGLGLLCLLIPVSAAAQTPVAPGNLTATFQPTGNATQLNWSTRGMYRTTADLRISGSYDYTATDAVSSWDSYGLRLTNWTANGNILRQGTLDLGAVILHYPGGDNLTDYTFAARVRAIPGLVNLGTKHIGIMFRYVNTNNYYYITLTQSQARLVKRSNGTETVLATFAMTRANNTWYSLRVELQGSSIKGFIDNTERLTATDATHPMGSFGMYTNNQIAEFTGPDTANAFQLRKALGFQAFSPATVRSQWTAWGPGTWTNTTYELRQSVNTPTETGYTHNKHGDRKDYTYTQQMRINPSSDNDIMGVVVRYTQNQASPHRFTGYLFEFSGGGSGGAPSRRLSRVINGGYGNHTGSNAWQRINHTTLKSDNTTWSSGTWYLLKVQVSGNNIKIWINGTLWADYTDNAANRIEKGSFGLLNYSNPNFNVRHITVRYAEKEFTDAVSASNTAVIGPTWTQLSQSTVGTIMATPLATWATNFSIPQAHIEVTQYKIAMADPSTFDGKLSTTSAGANTGTNPNAFPFGQQKTGTLRYNVYRNNVRLNNTPITTQTYLDQYGTCTPPPNTTYNYQVTTINPANLESPRSNTASATTANAAPTIAGVPNQTATHGQALVLNVSSYINDINVPNSTLTITAGSTYATVAGQVITFLYPLNDPITTESVKITVSDCHGATASQTITVTLNNRPPVFTSTPPTSATQNQQYAYTPSVVDPDQGDTQTFKVNKKPASATFDTTTGAIKWTPGSADVGQSFDFEIEVCDKANNCVKQSWTVKVSSNNTPPAFTSTPPTTGTEDQLYNYKPVVTDPDAGDTKTFKLNKAPAGATVDPATGEIKWTPGDADGGKDVDFELEVCDKEGACAKQSWTVKVTNVNDPPAFTSTPPTTGTEDQLYNYKPVVTDPDPSDTKTFKFTQSPPGATIDPATGEIKWTPGDADGGKDVDFEIEVCDASGTCVKQTWKVKVANVNDPPTITGTPPTTAQEKQLYTYEPKANDPDPGDNAGLTYKLKNAPKGASIDPATGKITWTPDADDVAAGSRDFELEVCDASGACTQQTWKVAVTNVNDPPVLTGTPPTSAEVGKAMTYSPQVTDPDPSDTHTWKLTKAPPGATIDPATGALSWTPATADAGKDIDFEIEVCDNGTPPACVKQSFKVKVNNPCSIDIDCPTGQICVTGSCVPAGCDALNPKCPTGELCVNGTCTKDPCDGVTCQTGEICRPSDGKCIKPCAGVVCQQDELCVDGACVNNPCNPPCKADEYCQTAGTQTPMCVKDPCRAGACRHDRQCQDGQCIPDPCAGLTCPQGLQCREGQCVDPKPCDLDIDCPTDQVCINRRCLPPGCYTGPACQAKEQCLKAKCEADPCDGNACSTGEYCRVTDGACAKPCSGVTCQAGELCVDGACKTDPCANVTCQAGETCLSGVCTRNLCNASNLCKHGRNCDKNQCLDDPCRSVTCPDASQVCLRGQCVPSGCQFDKDCQGTEICVNRKCIAATCPQTPCPAGQRCQEGKCLKDPCDGNTCQSDEVCKAAPGGNSNVCIGSCAGVFCPKGAICIGGQCLTDPCGNVQCNQGEVCQNGVCVKDNCTQGACKTGRLCRADQCIDDPCAGLNCPAGQMCQTQNTNTGDGQCTGDKPCKNDADCAGDGICIDGKCAPPGCYLEPCAAGKLCLKGQCVDDPCATKQCNANEVCRPADGTCVPTCPTCAQGERCVDGKCEADPCDGITCQSGERCDNGTCTKDACNDPNAQLCKYKRSCDKEACGDDLCTGITCTDGTCRNGTCTQPPVTNENITEGTTEQITEANTEAIADGGETPPDTTTDTTTDNVPGEITQTDNTNKDDANKDGGNTNDSIKDDLWSVSGGCGCHTLHNPQLPTLLLIFLLGLFLTRRRKT